MRTENLPIWMRWFSSMRAMSWFIGRAGLYFSWTETDLTRKTCSSSSCTLWSNSPTRTLTPLRNSLERTFKAYHLFLLHKMLIQFCSIISRVSDITLYTLTKMWSSVQQSLSSSHSRWILHRNESPCSGGKPEDRRSIRLSRANSMSQFVTKRKGWFTLFFVFAIPALKMTLFSCRPMNATFMWSAADVWSLNV